MPELVLHEHGVDAVLAPAPAAVSTVAKHGADDPAGHKRGGGLDDPAGHARHGADDPANHG